MCRISVVCACEAKMPLWDDCLTHSFWSSVQTIHTGRESNHQQFAPGVLVGYLRGSCENWCYLLLCFGFVNLQQKLKVLQFCHLSGHRRLLLSSPTIMVVGMSNFQDMDHSLHLKLLLTQQTLLSTFYVHNILQIWTIDQLQYLNCFLNTV